MKNNQNDRLFTELTPEEGSAVEGGAKLHIRSIFADKPSEDDPYIMVGGKKGIFKAKNFNRGSKDIFKTVSFTGDTTLSVWDEDPGDNNDDILGFGRIGSAPTGVKFVNVMGYRVSYQVTA